MVEQRRGVGQADQQMADEANAEVELDDRMHHAAARRRRGWCWIPWLENVRAHSGPCCYR